MNAKLVLLAVSLFLSICLACVSEISTTSTAALEQPRTANTTGVSGFASTLFNRIRGAGNNITKANNNDEETTEDEVDDDEGDEESGEGGDDEDEEAGEDEENDVNSDRSSVQVHPSKARELFTLKALILGPLIGLTLGKALLRGLLWAIVAYAMHLFFPGILSVLGLGTGLVGFARQMRPDYAQLIVHTLINLHDEFHRLPPVPINQAPNHYQLANTGHHY